MTEVVSVAATPGGWTVQADGLAGPLVFRSGARAEEAARRLADAYAMAGRSAEVRITARDGVLAGRFISVPAVDAFLADAALVDDLLALPKLRKSKALLSVLSQG